MRPVVFSEAWFRRHQRALLAVANAPVIGREFRAALALHRSDVGSDRRPIVGLLPHAYIVANPDGTYTMDIRTHAKFAKRLYYQFDPIWRAAHAWDRYVANPLAPALNVGFDTLMTFYPDPDPGVNSCDGTVSRDGVDEAWATIQAGAGVTATTSVTGGICVRILASTTTNQFQELRRGMFLFDSSALGRFGAVPLTAVVSIMGSGKLDSLGIAPDIDCYGLTTVSNNTLDPADFSTCGSTSYSGSPITFANWSTTGYNVFTMNATGLASVSTTGVSKFSLRNANYDVAVVAPGWVSGVASRINTTFADTLGTSQDPKLDVTFLYENMGQPYLHFKVGDGEGSSGPRVACAPVRGKFTPGIAR